MIPNNRLRVRGLLLLAAFALPCLVYWPGLGGSWFFDDYPNIVDNHDVQPSRLGFTEIVNAALSSPASDFKRPLASLSFVANHAMGGLDPFGWKLVNLVIHLANGFLVYLLALALFRACSRRGSPVHRADLAAVLVATGWLLLPINLTPVLLVVQRMESMANLFVLAGLLGYVAARLRMLRGNGGLGWAIASLVVPTTIGTLAKETAVMLPLYALLVEATLFRFRQHSGASDRKVMLTFGLVLVLPGIIGLALLLPGLLGSTIWQMRGFTVGTRLLTEARVVVDYIGWTLLPLPQSLSFYHDDFALSRSLLDPPSTLASLLAIAVLASFAWWLRNRRPLVALGIALYFGCHLLTATVLPLELVFEHRNYFASFGLLLAVVPLLVAPDPGPARVRHAVLGLLLAWWAGLTAITASAWANPLRLVSDLAARAPDSPRAQTEFGRALLLASEYSPDSVQFQRGLEVLGQASRLRGGSIEAEKSMILASSLAQLPVQPQWWDSLLAKLQAQAPNSEDVGALAALTKCAINKHCNLDPQRMNAAFAAAEAHPRVDAKLLAIHSDWAWNVLGDRVLGERLGEAAVQARPAEHEPRVALARMNLVMGRPAKAIEQLHAIERLNRAGRLDTTIAELRGLIQTHSTAP